MEGEGKVPTKKVSFFPNVRVHRRKIHEQYDDDDETSRSELWYGRSEYRAMKQDILAFRKIWRQQWWTAVDDDGNTEGESKSPLELDGSEYCPRGVEHFLFPELRRVRQKRRDTLLIILVDGKDSVDGDRISQSDGSTSFSGEGSSSSSSFSSYEFLFEILENVSHEAVLEALHRGKQDAKAAIEAYTCDVCPDRADRRIAQNR